MKMGLFVFISIIIVLLLLSTVFVFIPEENRKQVAKQEVIIVAQNEVPTIVSAVGYRKIKKITSFSKDGITQYTVQYDTVETVAKDRDSFVQKLKDKNYIFMKEQIDTQTTGIIQMIKEGVSKGTVVVAQITWEENQYQISYRVGEGLLQRDECEVKK